MVAPSVPPGGGREEAHSQPLEDCSKKRSHPTEEINSVTTFILNAIYYMSSGYILPECGRRKASDRFFWIQRLVGIPSKSIEAENRLS